MTIGKKIYKPLDTQEKLDEYSAEATWCNANNAYIEDKGAFYETIAVPEPILTDAKTAKNAENDRKAETARESQSFTVTLEGTELAFITDRKTQQDLQVALAFLQAGQPSYAWIDENGTSFNFTSASQIITVSEAFMAKANVYPKWQHFKQLIDAATTVAEVNAIVIDYGINLDIDD